MHLGPCLRVGMLLLSLTLDSTCCTELTGRCIVCMVMTSKKKTAQTKSRGKQQKSAFLAPVKGETASADLLLSFLQCSAGELALLQQGTALSKRLVISTSAARPYNSLSGALQLQHVLGHALNPASNVVTATQPLLPAGQELQHEPRNVATTLR